jgi:hypothetical protein
MSTTPLAAVVNDFRSPKSAPDLFELKQNAPVKGFLAEVPPEPPPSKLLPLKIIFSAYKLRKAQLEDLWLWFDPPPQPISLPPSSLPPVKGLLASEPLPSKLLPLKTIFSAYKLRKAQLASQMQTLSAGTTSQPLSQLITSSISQLLPQPPRMSAPTCVTPSIYLSQRCLSCYQLNKMQSRNVIFLEFKRRKQKRLDQLNEGKWEEEKQGDFNKSMDHKSWDTCRSSLNVATLDSCYELSPWCIEDHSLRKLPLSDPGPVKKPEKVVKQRFEVKNVEPYLKMPFDPEALPWSLPTTLISNNDDGVGSEVSDQTDLMSPRSRMTPSENFLAPENFLAHEDLPWNQPPSPTNRLTGSSGPRNDGLPSHLMIAAARARNLSERESRWKERDQKRQLTSLRTKSFQALNLMIADLDENSQMFTRNSILVNNLLSDSFAEAGKSPPVRLEGRLRCLVIPPDPTPQLKFKRKKITRSISVLNLPEYESGVLNQNEKKFKKSKKFCSLKNLQPYRSRMLTKNSLLSLVTSNFFGNQKLETNMSPIFSALSPSFSKSPFLSKFHSVHSPCGNHPSSMFTENMDLSLVTSNSFGNQKLETNMSPIFSALSPSFSESPILSKFPLLRSISPLSGRERVDKIITIRSTSTLPTKHSLRRSRTKRRTTKTYVKKIIDMIVSSHLIAHVPLKFFIPARCGFIVCVSSTYPEFLLIPNRKGVG